MALRSCLFVLNLTGFVSYLSGAQASNITATTEEAVPLAESPSRDATESPSSEGAPKEPQPEMKGAAPHPSGEYGQDPSNVDEFNAIDVASTIAQEVVREVDATTDKPDEVERVEEVEASAEETTAMNAEPAEETESPASSPKTEPLPLSLSPKSGPALKKKKRLRKKLATTISPSRASTPSPPRNDEVVNIPSSSEKSALGPKAIPGSTISESSDMDDLGENSEEGEQSSEDSEGKSDSDIFAGIGDIFHLPSFTPSKQLISTHPSHSEPARDDVDQTTLLPETGNIVVKHEGDHGVSSFVLPTYVLLADTRGTVKWRIKSCSVSVLRSLEKQYPDTFANCTAGRMVGGSLLDLLAETVICLQRLKVKDFDDQRYEDVSSSIKDMETFGIRLGWLRDYLERVRSTQNLFASYSAIRSSEEQIAAAEEKYNRLLAEAKEQISSLKASHESLVQKHQALEAAPKITLSSEEPVLPEADFISQKLSD